MKSERTSQDLISGDLIYGGEVDADDRIVGRIFTRRQAIGALSLAGFAALIGCGGGGAEGSTGTSGTLTTGSSTTGSSTTATTTSGTTTGTTGSTGGTIDLVATPEVTEGPYFVDEGLNRSDLTADTTRASVVNGRPLTLTLTIYELAGSTGTPLAGAHVDLWHTDAIGKYSDEASEGTSGQKWLRGYQVTDGDGKVTFETIYPGWYSGRTPHLHLKVRTYNASGNETYEFTTQLFFSEALSNEVYATVPYNSRGSRNTTNATDGIYSARQADGTAVGSHLLPTVTALSDGLLATFGIAFDSV